MGSGTSPMGKGGGAQSAPKAEQGNERATVSSSAVFLKGSLEALDNYIPGGKSAIASAWNESGGNGYRAARTIQEKSGSETKYLGKTDDYVEFSIKKFANSTPATIRVDTNAERVAKRNKQNRKTTSQIIGYGMMGR